MDSGDPRARRRDATAADSRTRVYSRPRCVDRVGSARTASPVLHVLSSQKMVRRPALMADPSQTAERSHASLRSIRPECRRAEVAKLCRFIRSRENSTGSSSLSENRAPSSRWRERGTCSLCIAPVTADLPQPCIVHGISALDVSCRRPLRIAEAFLRVLLSDPKRRRVRRWK